MAIKISGTTVIDDSRNITSINTTASGNTTITGFANVSSNLMVGSAPTTSPSALATIVSGTTVGQNYQISLAPVDGALGRESGIRFGATFSQGWAGVDYIARYSGAISYGAAGGGATPRLHAMKFYTGDGSDVPTERVRIDASGNVGIGNTAPAHKLSVNGTTNLAGAVTGITTLAAGNTTITGFSNVTSDGQFTGSVGIGIAPSSTAKLYVACTAISQDATYYGILSQFNDANTAITANRNRYSSLSIIENNSENKTSGGATTYNSSYIANYGLARNGGDTTGGDARAVNVEGGRFYAYQYANGLNSNTVSALVGTRSAAIQQGSGVVTGGYGLLGSVEAANSSVTGNVTTAYGVHSTVKSNTSMTIDTGYLYYGQHLGSTTTAQWGVYLTGEDKNYFSGNVGIGNTTPAHKLSVNGAIKATLQFDTDLGFYGLATDTAGAPSFTWTGDTDTGMFRPTTDTIAFSTGGAEEMRIAANGNIGIGNTTPAHLLSVGGTIATTGGANAISLINATSNWIYYSTAGVSAPTLTTRSAGTRLVLYPSLSGTNADYGIGIEFGHMWFSTGFASNGFKWYTNITNIMTANATGLDVSGNVTSERIRLNSTTDLSLTSTGHGFQIGPSTGTNLAMDVNEIMVRNNGAAATLNINVDGGDVNIGGNTNFNANALFTKSISANGSFGTANTVLISGGTSNSYWGAVTDAQLAVGSVRTKYAETVSYGGIGSYVLGYSRGTGIEHNTEYAGADIEPGGFYWGNTSALADDGAGSSPTAALGTKGGAALSGTWRAMGRANFDALNSRHRWTLYLRIA